MRKSPVLKSRRRDFDLSLFGESAAGSSSFGVSGVISSRKSSDSIDDVTISLFPKMRRDGEGESSRTGVGIGGSNLSKACGTGPPSDCSGVGDELDDPVVWVCGTGCSLEILGTGPSCESSSDTDETLVSVSFVTSGES